MKTIVITILLLASLDEIPNTSEYDVSNFYSSTEPDSGTKVLTSSGNLEEANLLLTPTSIDAGKYKITVTRKAKDLYKIDGKSIFIETKNCYEYATNEDVFLIIESNYGYSKGKIIF